MSSVSQSQATSPGSPLRRAFARTSAFDAIAALLCFVAWFTAFRATHDLEWPCESDLYRDLGAAQSFLDGNFGADPAYLGERGWYPPLVPTLVGLVSRVSAEPLHQTYTTGGLYLNLLAPIAFYALMAWLFGRRASLVTLTGFLFLGQLDWMSWLHATYSPWLWACNFAQALFYLAALGLAVAVRTRRVSAAVAAGTGIGLAGLAHVAPALLLGGMAVVLVLRELVAVRFRRPEALAYWRTLALMGFVAALVAAPFWWSLLVRYGFQVKNAPPLTWLAGELRLEAFGAFAARYVSVRGLFAFAGVIALFWPARDARGRIAKWALLAWGTLSAAGLGYGFLQQRVALPPLMPSWHFLFYFQAFESAAFGVGVVGVARLGARAFAALRKWDPSRLTPLARRCQEVALAGLLIFVLSRFTLYTERPDLTANRRDSLALAKQPFREFYGWLLENTQPDDVVLTEAWVGFFAGAAGRKVVVLPDLFSNPYVRQAQRARHASTMLGELTGQPRKELAKLARKYRVRYVALRADQYEHVHRLGTLRRLHAATDRREGFDVYALAPSDDTTARQ